MSVGDLTQRIIAVRCHGLSWLVISPMVSLPLGGKLRKESQLDHVRPTQAEKLMFSRARFLTHSIAMLRFGRMRWLGPQPAVCWEQK